MPLSEHEQRLLDEMERNLYQNDADFVANISATPRRKPAYRSIVLGVLVAVVGVGVLIAGVSFQIALIGILGFVLMFGGVLLAITPGRKRGADTLFTEAPGSKQAGGAKSSDFMDRLGERWDKRQDGER